MGHADIQNGYSDTAEKNKERKQKYFSVKSGVTRVIDEGEIE